MSTKELQKKLLDMGKSARGQRSVLIERYERYATEDDQEETLDDQEASETGVGSGHASEHPMMVMVDESTGNKYMRDVSHKGFGIDGDQS